MTTIDFFTIGFYFLVLLLLTPLLGTFMVRVYRGESHLLSKIVGPFERLLYRLCRIDAQEDMNGKRYLGALLLFSFFGMMAVFLLQIFQHLLPFNPASLPDVPWLLALSTAVSFMTNTNWQAYSGENTLSFMTQALGLGVQNFLSAATGMAVLVAFIRGLTNERRLGNFWVDMTRSVLYILLPLSLIGALILVSQGVPQTWGPYVDAQTLEGSTQTIPLGPAASQIAIKQLGTNGGGFFGVNSAHPLENPTALANFFEMLALLLLPSALIYMFAFMTAAKKHAFVLYIVMLGLLGGAIALGSYGEHSAPVATSMEGKETRLGVTNSLVWAMATTAASNGSVNAMHDSLSPLAGGVALLQMLLGEIIFGGVGSGLYGMILFVILTVFLAGLMVGRTPEYFGKKIEGYEIQLVLIALLAPCAVVLIGSSISILWPGVVANLINHGPHGLSEILYAWGSAANNNGSAFAGLSVNTNFFNSMLAIAMIIGRFVVIIPVILIAERFSLKKTIPPSPATFDTHGSIFALLLVSVILIVGALTFMPALVLGPVVEHLLMMSARSF